MKNDVNSETLRNTLKGTYYEKGRVTDVTIYSTIFETKQSFPKKIRHRTINKGRVELELGNHTIRLHFNNGFVEKILKLGSKRTEEVDSYFIRSIVEGKK